MYLTLNGLCSADDYYDIRIYDSEKTYYEERSYIPDFEFIMPSSDITIEIDFGTHGPV